MVAKTIGFNWGPAGTSTGVWTGIRLADVLRHCGMKSVEQGANYVCFRGPKNELPQGEPKATADCNTPNGHIGAAHNSTCL